MPTWRLQFKASLPVVGAVELRGRWQATSEADLLRQIRRDLPRLATDATPWWADAMAKRAL